MGRIFRIVKREYVAGVRTKWFLISTILGPALVTGMMLVPTLLISSGSDKTRCAVIDETGRLLEPLRVAAAEEEQLQSFQLIEAPAEPDVVEAYTQAVRNGEYDAFLVIPADVFESNRASYYAKGVGIATQRLDNVLTRVVTHERLAAEGYDADRIDGLTEWVSIDALQVRESGTAAKKDWGATYITSMVFVMFLYFSYMAYGSTVMNSTVEEKSTRVMEVLLARASPFEMLLGKVLGTGAVGLSQFVIWSAVGILLMTFGGGLSFLASEEVRGILSVSLFAWFVVFFLLGYFTMASLYAAVGSTCNTPREAAQLQFPLVLPIILSLMLSFGLLSVPDATWGVVLSFVPLMSPILMFVRILVQTPPLWQILLAVAINLLAILTTTWVGSRIYRIGVLMYGKRPTLPELARWIRASA